MTINTPGIQEKGSHSTNTALAAEETAKRLVSLLGIFRLDFNSYRDISNPRLGAVFKSGIYIVKNFEENGYGAIQTKSPDMGTGFALVSGEYFNVRGKIQGIGLYDESATVGNCSYENESGVRVSTPIYLVGSVLSEGKPKFGALHIDDIEKACDTLMGIEK